MKAFASEGYLLRRTRYEIRLVYSGFLVLVTLGMLTMAVFQAHHIGLTPARVAAYYRGGEVGGQMAFAKTFRELVEVTHFHAFIMGIVYLVLAHLFLATPMSAQRKQAVIMISFAGLAGDLLSPWLVRYAWEGFASLLLISWLAEWIGFAALIVIPMIEMWGGERQAAFPPE